MYAHVTNGTVDAVGEPPQTILQGRWWDLRTRDLDTLAAVGWYPVQEATRPADTATTTWEQAFTFDTDTVVQSWTEVPKTAERMQAELENSNHSALLTKAAAALQANIADIPALQTLAAGGAFANNTQRDNAIRGLASRALALTRQNNALIRVLAGLLATQDGT